MAGLEDLWIFAYGSLMWQPGFEYEEMRVAHLFGYHRAFCIYAWTFRGTREKPGLVLGLDRGGSCLGRAYRVGGDRREEVMRYLDAREIPDFKNADVLVDVYMRKCLSLTLDTKGAGPTSVKAVCYVADHRHPQYTGKLDRAEQAELIRQGHGTRGSSIDYLENTIRHLDELGIADGPLHQLWADLRVRPDE